MRPIFIRSGSRGAAAAYPVTITAEGAGAGGDQYYRNVALLLNFTGANGSTAITDESPTPKTLTAFGNASIQSNALSLDGTGDYVKLTPEVDDLLLAFPGRIFTIEGELNVAGSGDRHIIGYNNDDAGGENWWDLRLDSSRQIVFRYNQNSGILTTTGVMPSATNSHFELSFDGTTSRIFIDGVLAGSVASGIVPLYKRGILALGANLFGGGFEYYFNGSFNFFRITTDIARHTDTFTPPSGVLPNYAGRITGTIINSSAVTDFFVIAVDAATGREVGVTTTSTESFTINCDDTAQCIVTIYPQNGADYIAAPPYTYGSLVTPS
jgi:hypothetical protein